MLDSMPLYPAARLNIDEPYSATAKNFEVNRPHQIVLWRSLIIWIYQLGVRSCCSWHEYFKRHSVYTCLNPISVHGCEANQVLTVGHSADTGFIGIGVNNLRLKMDSRLGSGLLDIVS